MLVIKKTRKSKDNTLIIRMFNTYHLESSILYNFHLSVYFKLNIKFVTDDR